MSRDRRRLFIAAASALFASPLALLGETNRKYRIGVVDNTIPLADLVAIPPRDAEARALVEQLRALGWVSGQNIEIVWRSAEEDYRRRPQLIAELVKLPVDVILVYGNEAAREALRATRAIPIVMVSSLEVVREGLVASLARPGGNLTGLDMIADTNIAGKRLALLKQAAPRVTRVAFFAADYLRAESRYFLPTTIEAAKRLGITPVRMFFDGPASFERLFEDAVRSGVDGLLIGSYSALMAPRNQATIRALIERHRIPAIHASVDYTEAGAILNYGSEPRFAPKRAAFFVDRILRGAKAGDLPIEHPTTFVLVANKQAARAIGLKLPDSLLTQADRIIE